MTEFSVSIVLKQVQVSADSPTEAAAKAAEMVAADMNGNTTSVMVTKVERITVPGFKRP